MKNLLILIFLTLNGQSHAQFPDYYVYLVNGNATILKRGAKPMDVKQNQLVFNTDIIFLKNKAEITLVDRNANFLILNQSGKYSMKELQEKAIKKYNSGITSKYLSLLFHELLDPEQDFSKFKKENIAGVSGGVSREFIGNRIFPINEFKTSDTLIIFQWQRTSPSANYTLMFYDENGNELAKMNVLDTIKSVNTNKTFNGKPGKYLWQITSEDGKNEDENLFQFDLLSLSNEKELVAKLLATTEHETIEKQLLHIDKLERNGFIHVASTSFSDMVKANPANNALRKSFVSFLLKYGFDEVAAEAWK